MRIGVISDTHVRGDERLPEEILRAFQGVDLILHCGDLDHSTSVLDHLETVAPVKACRGYPDPKADGDRLANSPRVIEVGGIHIGMTHDIGWPGPAVRINTKLDLEFPPGDIPELMRAKFGHPVDIVAFGDSHEEYVGRHEGILFVNPGSALYPGIRHKLGDPGTVAVVNIHNGIATAEIVQLPPWGAESWLLSAARPTT